ncbi:MAG TPA: hypothetical protein VGK27_12800 [Candidatus Deferrimicrobiaceae bacterium]
MSGLSRAGTLAAAILLLGASALLSSRLSPGLASSGGQDGAVDNLAVAISRHPSLAIGFRNACADLVWLGAIQVAGNRKMAPADYDRLALLLDTAANFDPRFETIYLLGGLILGESPAHARWAVALLERGRKSHPESWQIPFYLGFTHYFILGQPIEGGRSMADASRLPGSPEYLPRLAARMLVEGKDPETALSFLAVMIRQEQDPARRAVLERRAADVAIERDLQRLERAVDSYRSTNGKLPASLTDLVRAGILSRLPVEPNGGAYRIDQEGNVFSNRSGRRIKVFVK